MADSASNANSGGQTRAQCVMCGTSIAPGSTSLELLCLICRAAMLDRIFQARRRRVRGLGSER